MLFTFSVTLNATGFVPIGQFFSHVPHSTQSADMLNRYLFLPIIPCNVPIGQNAHHTLGLKIIPRGIAMAVVMVHIVTNTKPIFSAAPPDWINLKIIKLINM